MLREPWQPPGMLGPHPPALRLVPEHGVGRLKRWFVFFCRAEGDTVGGVRDITLPLKNAEPLCAFVQLRASPHPLSSPSMETHTERGLQYKYADGCRPLTLQAWASSRAALRASRGFSMTRPAWPEKSMATRVLSETLLCKWDRMGRGGVRMGPKYPRDGAWVPPPANALMHTHQGWGPHTGWAQMARLCLLIILIQLHPILGDGERKRA